MAQPENKTVLDATRIEAKLVEMAAAIEDLVSEDEGVVLLGIQRRGVPLAERLGALLGRGSREVALGALDITLYRDDLETVGPKPVIGETRLPGDLEGKLVVIVDDVLYTGRTVRAALNELTDFGRPDRIALCVLIDRGGRELPIQADVVGLTVHVDSGERVDVFLTEVDGRDVVELSAGWR